MESFERLNEEPIEVDYILGTDYSPNEFDDGFIPVFEFEGQMYRLDEFIRVHNSEWVEDVYPDYIHGVEAFNVCPIFIELVDGYDVYVNVYRPAC